MRKPLGFVGTLLASATLASCSLMLSWDKMDGQACDENQQCLSGYSCVSGANTCVAINSVPEGSTCTDTEQCVVGLTCAPSLFVCAQECVAYYSTPATCGNGNYCLPVESSGGEACVSGTASCTDGNCRQTAPGVFSCHDYLGVCQPSEACTPSASLTDLGVGCDPPEATASHMCVAVSGSANACVTPCQITFTATGAYGDDCGNSTVFPRNCQPVGAEGSKRLACLDARRTDQSGLDGDTCTVIGAASCARGFGCVRATCRLYCDETVPTFCDDHGLVGRACCPVSDGGYAVCATDCTAL